MLAVPLHMQQCLQGCWALRRAFDPAAGWSLLKTSKQQGCAFLRVPHTYTTHAVGPCILQHIVLLEHLTGSLLAAHVPVYLCCRCGSSHQPDHQQAVCPPAALSPAQV
jgi:hypothetical protein